MTAHIHAALMAQYAQDAAETEAPWTRWESSWPSDGETVWSQLVSNPRWAIDQNYRRKPRTHMVNGIEVPAPMRDAPAFNDKYWLAGTTNSAFASEMTWRDDSYDRIWLERGLVHATREAAVANAMAMIGRKS